MFNLKGLIKGCTKHKVKKPKGRKPKDRKPKSRKPKRRRRNPPKKPSLIFAVEESRREHVLHRLELTHQP